MIFSNVLPEPNYNIPMPPVNNPEDMRDCEHCNKKNICKYKGFVDEAEMYILNFLNSNEKYKDFPLVIDIKCKEFSIGYTGVR